MSKFRIFLHVISVFLVFSCKSTHFVKEQISKTTIYKSDPSTFIKITSLITTASIWDGHIYIYPNVPGHYFAQIELFIKNNSDTILPFNFNQIQIKNEDGQIYEPEKNYISFAKNLRTKIKPLSSKKRTIIFQYPYKERPIYIIYKDKEYRIIYN